MHNDDNGPALTVGSAKCLCRACGRYFGGVHGFDMHRKSGRCIEPETVGLHLASDGFYRQPPPNGVRILGTIQPRITIDAGGAHAPG